jgi:hypothetical protein
MLSKSDTDYPFPVLKAAISQRVGFAEALSSLTSQKLTYNPLGNSLDFFSPT